MKFYFYGIRNKQKRAWNLAEKLEALQLLKKEGISKACRQLGLSSTTLYNWPRTFEQNGELGLSSKQDYDKNPEFERLKRENRELKMLVAEKRTAHPVQNELLKKSLTKSIRLLVAQDCIDTGIAKGLVLSLCQISRSSFYYKPHSGNKPAGRVCTTTTIKITGGYDNEYASGRRH